MGDKTGISWTDSTWNPVSGCSKVSPGCDHCYAEVIAERLRGSKAYPNGFDVTLKKNHLEDPLHWRQPRRIFVNSMSDLFHKGIPEDYLREVWDVMLEADQHIYQILTKRPHIAACRIADLNLELMPHIWIGTSVENQKFADNRIPELLQIPAETRFLSCEPLLEPISLSEWLAVPLYNVPRDGERLRQEIGWVIVGGESGPKRRYMDPDWIRSIRDQCLAAGVPFFYKQASAMKPGQDRVIDGRTWDQYPDAIQAPQSHQIAMNV